MALTFSVDPDEQLADAKRKVEMKRAKAEQVANSAASREEPALGQAGVRRLAFFVCGRSISAMVLPGVSGSFVLILLGVYFDILQAVIERDMVIVGYRAWLGLGCYCSPVCSSGYWRGFTIRPLHS